MMRALAKTTNFLIIQFFLLSILAGCDGGGGGGGQGTPASSGTNTAPVAKAGPDQTVEVSGVVQLNGSTSSDADGNSLSYQWTLLQRPVGSNATLSDANSVKASFKLDSPGDYVAQLIVNDGQANSIPDSVVISTQNSKPVANAGKDQPAKVGATVQLNGSASSDPDGNPLSYQWTLQKPAGSNASLIGPGSAKPGFVVDVPGDYVATLVVNDGQVNSDPDTVTISTQNTKPVANAGADQPVKVGATVQLDGSASSDPDGNPLSYQWTLQKPAGSNASLIGPGSAKPGFVVDVPGDYVATLVVNDGQVDSSPDTVIVSTENVPPVADAGSGQTVKLGDTVTLDGSNSTDADGDSITYSWSLSNKPAGSTAALSDPTASKPTFVADKSGSYTATLVVNDGKVNSDPDEVIIATENVPPVANAGPDQKTKVNTIVTLDGTHSTDVDGDILSYQWKLVQQPTGSSASLIGPGSPKPGIEVDMPGTYEVQLIVNDGQVNSNPDTVIVSTENVPPVANAGSDQTVKLGDTVLLNGSNSTDADGDSITYSWSLSNKPAGSTAALSDPTASKPTFVADKSGSYTATLVVNDGKVDSDSNEVIISTENVPPIANAGPDQTSKVGNTVTLDGSGSTDADGNKLTYSWSLITKPANSTATLLGDQGGVNPGFVVDQPGDYVAQLIVNDGQVNSDPDTVTISTQNTKPVANAGADQTSKVGNTVTLDGSSSTDVDGNTLSYQWTLQKPAGSNASLLGANSATPGFVIDKPGDYVATLVVNDGQVNSDPDSVTISTQNTKPVANAGPDSSTVVGNTVLLNGGGSSDPDNDPLTYHWSLITRPSGSAATLIGPTSVSSGFVVDKSGTYVAQLIVNDGQVNSDPDTATITTENVKPVANAGSYEPVLTGSTVQLDGSQSSDPDNDPLTYSWSLTKPTGSAATLSNPAVVDPTFVADLAGNYTVQLIVYDGKLYSDPSTATIQAPKPIALGSTSTAVSIGKDRQISSRLLLEIPAPPQGTTVTLTSADPDKVKLSNDATTVGSGQIQVVVNGGESFSPPFIFQSFANSGSVKINATAPNYPDGTITVNLFPSGFVIQPTLPPIVTSVGSSTLVYIQAYMLSASNAPTTLQPVRAGLTANVPVTSDNTAIGTISTSPVVITANGTTGQTNFVGRSVGATIVRVGTPPGYATPTANQSIIATVK